MNTLWFVVPAHGRLGIAEVCYRQLTRTIERLLDHGVFASAVVISDDENLELARDQGFATVERNNTWLGAKINDGYEAAAREGVQFVMPLGNDDWVDADWVAGPLPGNGEIRCARQSSIVDETFSRLAKLDIKYEAGDGCRLYPTSLFRHLNYRPVDEDRHRAIDTSTLMRVKKNQQIKLVYHDLHPLQIVDFKTRGAQLNPFDGCLAFGDDTQVDPVPALLERYPSVAVDEMQAAYGVLCA